MLNIIDPPFPLYRFGLCLIVSTTLVACGAEKEASQPNRDRATVPTEPLPDLEPLVTQPNVKLVYPNVPGSFVAISKKVKPSVVNIFTAQIVRKSPFHEWLGSEGLFGRYHRERIQRSLGSGFIIDAQGYVLTNYHVIRGADQILVQLEDEREVSVMVVGADPGIDVALLHLEDTGLSPVAMGNSDQLEVGEWVLAIGNPLGLSHTVTAGIVSAKGRDYSDLGMGQRGYQNFIQTDASINPGNSGGPLINTNGEVVGMNTAVAASGQGLGFAVPINMVRAVLPQLKRTGRVVPSWLGIAIRDLTPKLQARLGAPSGILVTQIYEHGPATGLLSVGDVIIEFNGMKVDGSSELSWFTSTAGVGNTVKLKVLRDGETLDIPIRVSEKPRMR